MNENKDKAEPEIGEYSVQWALDDAIDQELQCLLSLPQVAWPKRNLQLQFPCMVGYLEPLNCGSLRLIGLLPNT